MNAPKNRPGKIKNASSEIVNHVDSRCGKETERYESKPEMLDKITNRNESLTIATSIQVI